MGISESAGSSSITAKLPTLRLRFKIILGFAVTLAISAASMGIAYLGFERVAAGVASLPLQRVGSGSGAQHRPRADLVPVAGAILRGDRQGRGRQGGAGRRSQPEGRHRSIDEGHDQSRPARTGCALGQGIPELHQDFRRHSQAQGRERAGHAKSADAQRQYAALQARRSSQQRRRCRTAVDPVRRQDSNRSISGGDGARQHIRRQFRQDDRGQRTGAAQIRR